MLDDPHRRSRDRDAVDVRQRQPSAQGAGGRIDLVDALGHGESARRPDRVGTEGERAAPAHRHAREDSVGARIDVEQVAAERAARVPGPDPHRAGAGGIAPLRAHLDPREHAAAAGIDADDASGEVGDP